MTSPLATGAAGTFFEQHVDAASLALLLIRNIPPILIDCELTEVHFQTGHLGWRTDDLLLAGTDASGRKRCVAGQVKTAFTLSDSDEECGKTFTGFWQDFQNPSLFNPATDRLAIVVQQGTRKLLGNLSAVVDCARASHDAADFVNRVRSPGYVSDTARRYAADIRAIAESANGTSIADDEFWRFAKVIDLLSFDLNTSTRQTEAWIKTLLASTAVGPHQQGAADATWNELLALVGSGMPHAATFTRQELPIHLQERHTPLGNAEHAALRALREHSAPILQRIRTTIGPACHLGREQLVSQVREQLEQARVVLITGPAGSGKSAVAKEVFLQLQGDQFAFAFRAEEFATPYADETLQRAQVPLRATQLAALLAGQSRKVLLIESVERLLEASVRDGFSDLLALVRQDETWRVLLTCREYSLDRVRSSFLEHADLPHAVIGVPPLDDPDIEAAVQAIPTLARPAANRAMRTLFRNPYLLDKAARMEWPDNATLPQDERTFRAKFWRDVVREDDRTMRGLPRRREEALLQIALRRAQALTPYARCDDLHAEVLQGLRQCDLIAFPAATDAVAAPAHDVLEDWALLQWIEERFAVHQGAPSHLAEDLGTWPAVRRAYRKWLGELLECDQRTADSLVGSVFADTTLPPQFRDDTIVSVLLSSNAAEYVRRNHVLFLADDARLLRRVVHLLRLACKTTPSWLPPTERTPAAFFVPHGTAWASVLALIRRHLETFLPREVALIVGLVEDWSQGVTWWSPYPDGAEDAAAIAFQLLPLLDDYRSDDLRKRTLQVIAKIPRANEESFLALISRAASGDRQDQMAEELAEVLLDDMSGSASCRDFPDAIMHLADSVLCLSDDADDFHDDWSSDLELEPLFGLGPWPHFKFFPASAIRGPFLPLLRYHRRRGADFILRLLNRCAERYAHPRYPHPYVEPPSEVQLELPDGTRVRQWCNGRLWQLYRGTSVGPCVLQCALMALEEWLLELCEAASQHVERWLLHFLRQTNNAAITGVVASVAMAHPHRAGAAGLALLTCRDLIVLDRLRIVGEGQSPTAVGAAFPHWRAENRLYYGERAKADALPHRHTDLEAMALNLQLGPHQERVWQILDAHRQNLPRESEQTEEDRLWRLALHRMDLRQYRAEAAPDQEDEVASAPPPAEDSGQTGEAAARGPRVLFQLNPPAPDIQEMIDRDAPARETDNAMLSLFMWGFNVFRREGVSAADAQTWRDRLHEARQIAEGVGRTLPAPSVEAYWHGPSFVAAVCVRDHWDELAEDDRQWCVQVLLDAVAQQCDSPDELVRVSNYPMDGSRPAAFVLPSLFGKDISPATRKRVLEGLSLALTHAANQVVDYAIEGIGSFLWSADPMMVRLCVGAIAKRARLLDAMLARDRRRPFDERRRSPELERAVATPVRRAICDGICDCERELSRLRFGGWYGRHAIPRILTILGRRPDEPSACRFFARVARAVARWGRPKDSRRSHRRDRRPIELEYRCLHLLARFVLQVPHADAMELCRPLLDSVHRHPREAAGFIRALVTAEDQMATKAAFWGVWQAVVDRIAGAPWIAQLDSEHSEHQEALDAAFLVGYWREDISHWHGVEGFADRVDALFERLPACACVLNAYVRFLYQIGARSLPGAFALISRRVTQGGHRNMLTDSNTLFCVESLLRRFVYTSPHRLKSDPALRDAVLDLLDDLIEAGSSAAYRMRDDFVTPASPP